MAGLHVAAVAGLSGVKEASLKIEGVKPEWKFLEGVTLEVAVAHGLSNAQRLIASIRTGKKALPAQLPDREKASSQGTAR